MIPSILPLFSLGNSSIITNEFIFPPKEASHPIKNIKIISIGPIGNKMQK